MFITHLLIVQWFMPQLHTDPQPVMAYLKEAHSEEFRILP